MNRATTPCGPGYGRRMLAVWLIALPVLTAPATRAASLLLVPELGVQLRMPDGWRVLETRPEAGAVLGAADDPDARVEVVVWQPIAEKLSAGAAALAHEQVLGASLTYTRRSSSAFTAADGSEAVLTEGLAETGDGARYAALFCAYCMGGKYYVLGTFCTIGQTEQVASGYLSDAARTFSPIGAKVPDIVVAAAPRTGTDTPPGPGPTALDPGAASTVTDTPPSTGGETTPGPTTPSAPDPTRAGPGPAAPPSDPPAVIDTARTPLVPESFALHRDPLGFALAAPEGWTVSTEGGCVTCWPAERPRVGGFVIWPVLSDQAQGDVRIQVLARSLAMHLRTTWQTLSTRKADESGRLWLCHGSMVIDDAPMSAVAVLARSENLDVLSLLLASDKLGIPDRLTLARALSGFESVPLWVDASPSTGAGVWLSEDGALRAEPPPGWEISGGVVFYNEMPAIEVQGVHKGTGSRFSWRQPELPCLKHPSERLVDAGWKEGAHFAPDRGVDSLVLARRVNAVTACRDRTMAGHKVGVTQSRELLTAGALLEGGEGAYASTETAEMVSTCVGAVGAAPRDFGRDCWMVATLMYEASQDTAIATCGALRAFIEGIRVLDGWAATEEQRRALKQWVTGAKEAVLALPPGPNAGDQMTPVVPALSHLVPDGSPEAIQGEVAPELSRLWRLASREGGARELLPELLEGAEGE